MSGAGEAPEILFRDERFVVLNKPAGLPVHAGPRAGPSVEDWFPLLSRRRSGPWLVHRLDADTSGCLLVALRHRALIEAQAAFAAGRVERLYWAWVSGEPPEDAGEIAQPLLKRHDRGGWRVVVDAGGQSAATRWQVIERRDGCTWIALRPQTGRTHQLRVHCAWAGWPIAGDTLYGRGEAGGLRLLARELRLGLEPPVGAIAESRFFGRSAQ